MSAVRIGASWVPWMVKETGFCVPSIEETVKVSIRISPAARPCTSALSTL
ncbi:hypothetical protein ACVWXM_001358 [Bradyrhizobium sp. GM7.3]